MGPLTGGSQCRMSNLRIGNVPCHFLCIIHVDFEIVECHMSNLRNGPCHITNIFSMSIGFMSHVDLKKGHVALSNLGVKGPIFTDNEKPVGAPPHVQRPLLYS